MLVFCFPGFGFLFGRLGEDFTRSLNLGTCWFGCFECAGFLDMSLQSARIVGLQTLVGFCCSVGEC